ncbi:hypothetical protein [Alicyclobacillus sp. ALC3]|uniref:hypothetical protein n=1 Tax=Alicyclobacillus sp. ALC3 TaxID=2796143 RepID=UPI002379C980|nr:hypothetical protein [Alicyclobacillus sp. ALC3]WDL98614.1 hypothetical protein JC200_08090 [Alicyclobacillus sp. ALC3]
MVEFVIELAGLLLLVMSALGSIVLGWIDDGTHSFVAETGATVARGYVIVSGT